MESSSDDEYSNAKNLPDTPLVSFDLNFESLKSFLEGISHIVNDHTKIIKKMNFQMRQFTTQKDTTKILGALAHSVPLQIPEVDHNLTGSTWEDYLQPTTENIFQMGMSTVNLLQFQEQTNKKLDSIMKKISKRVRSDLFNERYEELRDLCELKIERFSKSITDEFKETSQKYGDQVTELEKKFQLLEMNTYWKIKDCEALLQTRISEKYVLDQIKTVQEKQDLKLFAKTKELTQDYEWKIKQQRLAANERMEKFQQDLKTFKQSLEHSNEMQVVVRLSHKAEHLSVQQILKDIADLKVKVYFPDIVQDIRQHEEKFTVMQDQIEKIHNCLDFQWIQDDFLRINKKIKFQQKEIMQKLTMNDILPLIEDLKANQPSTENQILQIRALQRFRDQTTEQLRLLERKANKALTSTNKSKLKTQIGSKADSRQVMQEIKQQYQLISAQEKHIKQLQKSHGATQSALQRLQSSIKEIPTNVNHSMASTRGLTNCISCKWNEQPNPLSSDRKNYGRLSRQRDKSVIIDEDQGLQYQLGMIKLRKQDRPKSAVRQQKMVKVIYVDQGKVVLNSQDVNQESLNLICDKLNIQREDVFVLDQGGIMHQQLDPGMSKAYLFRKSQINKNFSVQFVRWQEINTLPNQYQMPPQFDFRIIRQRFSTISQTLEEIEFQFNQQSERYKNFFFNYMSHKDTIERICKSVKHRINAGDSLMKCTMLYQDEVIKRHRDLKQQAEAILEEIVGQKHHYSEKVQKLVKTFPQCEEIGVHPSILQKSLDKVNRLAIILVNCLNQIEEKLEELENDFFDSQGSLSNSSITLDRFLSNVKQQNFAQYEPMFQEGLNICIAYWQFRQQLEEFQHCPSQEHQQRLQDLIDYQNILTQYQNAQNLQEIVNILQKYYTDAQNNEKRINNLYNFSSVKFFVQAVQKLKHKICSKLDQVDNRLAKLRINKSILYIPEKFSQAFAAAQQQAQSEKEAQIEIKRLYKRLVECIIYDYKQKEKFLQDYGNILPSNFFKDTLQIPVPISEVTPFIQFENCQQEQLLNCSKFAIISHYENLLKQKQELFQQKNSQQDRILQFSQNELIQISRKLVEAKQENELLKQAIEKCHDSLQSLRQADYYNELLKSINENLDNIKFQEASYKTAIIANLQILSEENSYLRSIIS